MRLNPIVKKELKVSSRSMKLCWGLFAYEAVLVMVFLLVLSIMEAAQGYLYDDENVYTYLIYLYPVIGIMQLGIIAMIMPIITASSISGERERQTFDIMLTTCMSPFSIVWGKLLTAILQILLYVVASLPIMGLSFVIGGLEWHNLLIYFLTVVIVAFFSGSIGIYCSSICRKSITAIVLSFVFYVGIYGMTFFPMLVRAIFGTDTMGESALVLLFNPGVLIEEVFVLSMGEESIFTGNNINSTDAGVLTYILIRLNIWPWISAICIIILGLAFMLLATGRINPMRTGKKK